MIKKKLLAGVAAAALGLACLLPTGITAAAANSKTVTAALGSTEGSVGDEITVDVNLTANDGVSILALVLEYDASALEYQKSANGNTGLALSADGGAGEVSLLWYTLDGYSSSTGTAATVTFKILDTSASSASLSITADANNPSYFLDDDLNETQVTIKGGTGTVTVKSSDSSVTEPDVTEPDVTEPDVTEPDVTEPDVTEPPVTAAPVDTIHSHTKLNRVLDGSYYVYYWEDGCEYERVYYANDSTWERDFWSAANNAAQTSAGTPDQTITENVAAGAGIIENPSTGIANVFVAVIGAGAAIAAAAVLAGKAGKQ